MRRGIWAGTVTLTNLKTVRDAKGNTRRYYQVKGQPLIRLPDAPLDSAEFLAAYAAARAKTPAAAKTAPPGSLSHLCDATLRSTAYRALSENYRRAMLPHIMAIQRSYGTALARDLRARHINADLAKLTAAVGQLRLKAWRLLCKHGLVINAITADPTEAVKKPRLPKSAGIAPWTRAEVDLFRARWPLGTTTRAIFELLHWTGCRISDAVKLSRGMVDRDGVLTYAQQKTGGLAYVPWTCALPPHAAHMEADRDLLHQALQATAGHLTFITTRSGAPRSAKAIGGDIAAAAKAAGITRSAHGLRKTRAIELAESGATSHQIGAWTGHESLAEIAHYTQAAERRRAVMGTEREGNVGKPAIPVGKR